MTPDEHEHYVIECPDCDTWLHVDENPVGGQVTCPECGLVMNVTDLE